VADPIAPNAKPAQLRQRYRAARRLLSPAEQAAHADTVARAVVSSRIFFRTGPVALYFTATDDGELDTAPLLARYWAAGRTVACPVVHGPGEMTFFRVRPDTVLVPNRFGIPEPRTRGPGASRPLEALAIRTVFVPLVAFDDHGTRLGMGAGYYDRYLARLPVQLRPLVIGLAHDVQRARESLPRQSWDIPLDAVVTESGWQAFSHRAMV